MGNGLEKWIFKSGKIQKNPKGRIKNPKNIPMQGAFQRMDFI
jgi:hypothetical protein